MTPQQFAELLNGRQYREEITKEECAIAKENGLVVAFGASDDLLEFRGAIYDETGAYNSATVLVLNGKVVQEDELEKDSEVLKKYGFSLPDGVIKVTAKWCPKELDASWLITTTAPNAYSFDVQEDDDLYCRGVVFAIEG